MKKVLLLIASVMIFSGCSEAEKQKRQDNAYNLEGEYKASANAGSEVDFDMLIANEGSRHDILMTLNRTGNLTQKEVDFFRAQGLDPARVAATFASQIILGKGTQYEMQGGEVISDDFGESSKVSVYSDEMNYDSQTKVQYFVYATIKKADYVLRGRLEAVVSKTKQVDDGHGGKVAQTDSVTIDLSFNAKTDNVFYNQYFGNWNGSVTLNTSVNSDVTKITRLVLTKVDAQTFKTSPNASSVAFNGSAFNFDNKTYALTDLSRYATPVVQMNFVLSATESVVLYGQIWSLGTLTGSVVYTNSSGSTSIGSFTFKHE